MNNYNNNEINKSNNENIENEIMLGRMYLFGEYHFVIY